MRIAVAGAGIAGLAGALALSGRGHEITLYEKRTGFGETGAGIQLSPNATRALFGLGLEGAVGRSACEPGLIRIRSLLRGREIATVALGPYMRERFGSPFLALARSDLHTALLDAVRGRSDIRLRVGRGVARIDAASADRVRLAVRSEGGAKAEVEADLLVGADGLWSAVRPAVAPGATPRHAGYAAARAVLDAGALPDGLRADETGLWLGAGRHVVHYGIAGGGLVNVVAVFRRADRLEGWSAGQEAERVRAAFADAAPRLRRLVESAGSWQAWSLHAMPATRMARGRIALIGDAAHPVLPYLAQGGGLAIEDAVELAAALHRMPDRTEAALAAYERARLGRVRRVQSAAARNGFAYHAAAPIAAIRNLVMRRLGPLGMSERYAWLYGWRPGATEPAA